MSDKMCDADNECVNCLRNSLPDAFHVQRPVVVMNLCVGCTLEKFHTATRKGECCKSWLWVTLRCNLIVSLPRLHRYVVVVHLHAPSRLHAKMLLMVLLRQRQLTFNGARYVVSKSSAAISWESVPSTPRASPTIRNVSRVQLSFLHRRSSDWRALGASSSTPEWDKLLQLNSHNRLAKSMSLLLVSERLADSHLVMISAPTSHKCSSIWSMLLFRFWLGECLADIISRTISTYCD